MKENVEKNTRFIALHQEWASNPNGRTREQFDREVETAFGITSHSRRAWLSRLKLGYGAAFDSSGVLTQAGRYTEAIIPFMQTPSRKNIIVPIIEAAVAQTGASL